MMLSTSENICMKCYVVQHRLNMYLKYAGLLTICSPRISSFTEKGNVLILEWNATLYITNSKKQIIICAQILTDDIFNDKSDIKMIVLSYFPILVCTITSEFLYNLQCTITEIYVF